MGNKKAKGGGFLLLLILLVVIYFVFVPSANTVFPKDVTSNITSFVSQPRADVDVNSTNFAHNILPNSMLTPGNILTRNLSIICVTGYTAIVRDVTQSTREEVFREYNIPYPQPEGTTELDHLIPLELGGSNDKTNLFVEFAEPRPGFHEKDKLENYLHDHVCSGEIDLTYAQWRVSQDWYKYYQEIYGK